MRVLALELIVVDHYLLERRVAERVDNDPDREHRTDPPGGQRAAGG